MGAKNSLLEILHDSSNNSSNNYSYMPCCFYSMDINIIIIDIDYFNAQKLTKNLNNLDNGLNTNFKIEKFDNLAEAFEKIKEIKFAETFIILKEEIKNQFIEKFKDNLTIMKIIPKIIILNLNENEESIITKDFYCYGKMNSLQINKYLIELFDNRIKKSKEIFSNQIKKEYNSDKFCFEYNKEKDLSKIYSLLLENIESKKIEEFNEYLFNNYLDEFGGLITQELFQIYDMHNIPIELLSKYYLKMYSLGFSFCNDLKNDLMTSKGLDSPFIPMIKILYNSMKLQAFELKSNNLLYCAAELKDYEIDIFKKCFENSSKLIISKRFFSFTEEIDIALKFKDMKNYNTLFQLENKYEKNTKLATYANIQKISSLDEKEILIFPFSAFKVLGFQCNTEKKEYTIKLLNENIIDCIKAEEEKRKQDKID